MISKTILVALIALSALTLAATGANSVQAHRYMNYNHYYPPRYDYQQPVYRPPDYQPIYSQPPPPPPPPDLNTYPVYGQNADNNRYSQAVDNSGNVKNNGDVVATTKCSNADVCNTVVTTINGNGNIINIDTAGASSQGQDPNGNNNGP